VIFYNLNLTATQHLKANFEGVKGKIAIATSKYLIEQA